MKKRLFLGFLLIIALIVLIVGCAMDSVRSKKAFIYKTEIYDDQGNLMKKQVIAYKEDATQYVDLDIPGDRESFYIKFIKTDSAKIEVKDKDGNIIKPELDFTYKVKIAKNIELFIDNALTKQNLYVTLTSEKKEVRNYVFRMYPTSGMSFSEFIIKKTDNIPQDVAASQISSDKVIVSVNTDLTEDSIFNNLIAVFKHNGYIVRVGSNIQISGQTANDFGPTNKMNGQYGVINYKIYSYSGYASTVSVYVGFDNTTKFSSYDIKNHFYADTTNDIAWLLVAPYLDNPTKNGDYVKEKYDSASTKPKVYIAGTSMEMANILKNIYMDYENSRYEVDFLGYCNGACVFGIAIPISLAGSSLYPTLKYRFYNHVSNDNAQVDVPKAPYISGSDNAFNFDNANYVP